MLVTRGAFPLPAIGLVRRLLLLGLVAVTAGCMEWRGTSLPAPAPDAPRRLGAARVTTVDGRTLELDAVVLTADSLVGSRAGGPRASERLALHRSEVRHLDRRGLAFGRTVLLTTIVSLIVTVLAATAVLTVSC
jgi:hypothetical protein